MRYELFGISPVGTLEFLGSFGKMTRMLDVIDEYIGQGYQHIQFIPWK